MRKTDRRLFKSPTTHTVSIAPPADTFMVETNDASISHDPQFTSHRYVFYYHPHAWHHPLLILIHPCAGKISQTITSPPRSWWFYYTLFQWCPHLAYPHCLLFFEPATFITNSTEPHCRMLPLRPLRPPITIVRHISILSPFLLPIFWHTLIRALHICLLLYREISPC